MSLCAFALGTLWAAFRGYMSFGCLVIEEIVDNGNSYYLRQIGGFEGGLLMKLRQDFFLRLAAPIDFLICGVHCPGWAVCASKKPEENSR
jgi:hypothetical protein